MIAFKSRRSDPRDMELLERAVDAAMAAIKATGQDLDFDSDDDLEVALRHDLIEIARLNGVSEPEILRDILLDNSRPSTAR